MLYVHICENHKLKTRRQFIFYHIVTCISSAKQRQANTCSRGLEKSVEIRTTEDLIRTRKELVSKEIN
jgi:hypothetical protein